MLRFLSCHVSMTAKAFPGTGGSMHLSCQRHFPSRERDQRVQVNCWLLRSLSQKSQHKELCHCLWKTNLSWTQSDLKYAEGKQRDCRRCPEERRTKEKKKKNPKIWHLNFQSLFSLFQPQPKRSNLQTVCRVTQPKALLWRSLSWEILGREGKAEIWPLHLSGCLICDYLGPVLAEQKKFWITPLSTRGLEADKAQQQPSSCWREGMQTSVPTAKKNITDMIQDFFSPQKQLQILRKENKRLECISALHLIPTHTTHQDTRALSNLI